MKLLHESSWYSLPCPYKKSILVYFVEMNMIEMKLVSLERVYLWLWIITVIAAGIVAHLRRIGQCVFKTVKWEDVAVCKQIIVCIIDYIFLSNLKTNIFITKFITYSDYSKTIRIFKKIIDLCKIKNFQWYYFYLEHLTARNVCALQCKCKFPRRLYPG